MGDADLEVALAILMARPAWTGRADLMGEAGMDGRPGFAAGRAGDFIIAGVTQADVTEIIDVVDGTTDSLAESPEAQQVAAELPAETLSFTYLNGEAILDAVGERTLQKLQAMMSPAEQAVWQSHSGMAVSAVEPGFRIDAMTVPAREGVSGPPPLPMIQPSPPPRSGFRQTRFSTRPAWFRRTHSPARPTCWHWPSTVRWPVRNRRAG